MYRVISYSSQLDDHAERYPRGTAACCVPRAAWIYIYIYIVIYIYIYMYIGVASTKCPHTLRGTLLPLSTTLRDGSTNDNIAFCKTEVFGECHVFVMHYQWPSRIFISTLIGWHHMSDATCLMRPLLFYAFLVVSRITIIRYTVLHCRRNHALDK